VYRNLELLIAACHIWDHTVPLQPDTGERAPPEPQPGRPVIDLPTPEGSKAELTWWLVVYRTEMVYLSADSRPCKYITTF